MDQNIIDVNFSKNYALDGFHGSTVADMPHLYLPQQLYAIANGNGIKFFHSDRVTNFIEDRKLFQNLKAEEVPMLESLFFMAMKDTVALSGKITPQVKLLIRDYFSKLRPKVSFDVESPEFYYKISPIELKQIQAKFSCPLKRINQESVNTPTGSKRWSE